MVSFVKGLVESEDVNGDDEDEENKRSKYLDAYIGDLLTLLSEVFNISITQNYQPL